jgi:hypothetical protein
LDETERWLHFAGIDWGGQHHQLCIVDGSGQRVAQLRVGHDVAGLAELDRQMLMFAGRVPVAIERSEGLLVEHLQERGHAVFRSRRGSRPAGSCFS